MNSAAIVAVLVAVIVVVVAVLVVRRRRKPAPPLPLSATSEDRTIVGLAAPRGASDATIVGPIVAPPGPAAADIMAVPPAPTPPSVPAAQATPPSSTGTPAAAAADAPTVAMAAPRPDETEPTVRIPKLRAVVTVIRGGSGRYELSSREYAIGRSTRSDIVLEDPSVSGHHALLIPHGEAFAIHDLASTNGTTVNGRPVTAMQDLHGEETIGIGDALLRYERVI